MSQTTATIRNAREIVAKHMNKIARQYYAHNNDEDADGNTTLYFCGGRWGFWVDADGIVVADLTSANGELPAKTIVAACVRAAKKYLG
jgi:hypothetical protein